MLEKVSISEAIRQRRRRAIAHANITNDEVLGSAVFNMFTSVRDLLDEKGSFNFEKACETGAIDVVKKHKETRKTTFDPATNQTQTTVIVEVELESPAAARKEVANYIDLEKAPLMRVKDLSDEDFARELYRRLVDKRGMSEKDALLGIKAEFPEMDVKLLTNGTVNNTKNS